MLSKLVEVMPNSNTIFLTLLIPAYNEEHRISDSLNHIITYLGQQTYTSEIIVIDDGSSDKTAQLVALLPTVKLIKLSRNFGKGFATRFWALQERQLLGTTAKKIQIEEISHRPYACPVPINPTKYASTPCDAPK